MGINILGRECLENDPATALVHFIHEVGYRGVIGIKPLVAKQANDAFDQWLAKCRIGPVYDLKTDVCSGQQALQSELEIAGTGEICDMTIPPQAPYGVVIATAGEAVRKKMQPDLVVQVFDLSKPACTRVFKTLHVA